VGQLDRTDQFDRKVQLKLYTADEIESGVICRGCGSNLSAYFTQRGQIEVELCETCMETYGPTYDA